MRRVIEDLVEKRKARQQELTGSLRELAAALEKRSFFQKAPAQVRQSLNRFQQALEAFITAQDKEWDAYASNHATTVFKSLEWKIEKLEAETLHAKSLLIHFAELENRLERLLRDWPSAPSAEAAAGLRQAQERLSPVQYADFEQRFRGRCEAVAARLAKHVGHFPAGGVVLDVGCGRGEFMQLLRDSGRRPLGIDLSPSMLEAARGLGLDVEQADAGAYLAQRADTSLDGVFAAQVIEHMPPETLRRLVAESFRTLRPGGVLLLETINPLSLFALSRIFFLDPSHRQPLHPEYMRYLLENSGFSGVEILFGEEPEAEKLAAVDPAAPQALPFNENVDRLNRLLFAASEYAVKGTKLTAGKAPRP